LRGAGGGTAAIQITLSDDLNGRIVSASRGVAVQVVQAGIAANNQLIPGMLAQREAR
jgi:hypothetical protein